MFRDFKEHMLKPPLCKKFALTLYLLLFFSFHKFKERGQIKTKLHKAPGKLILLIFYLRLSNCESNFPLNVCKWPPGITELHPEKCINENGVMEQ